MTSHPAPEEPHALVIGDVHGNYDRLYALLEQEGIIKDGERVDKDAEVIQLGDLGDFRENHRGDRACFHAVRDDWIDIVLWGNHDRAVVDQRHQFNGYKKPPAEFTHIFKMLEINRKLRFAYAIHGHLLTHAGLHDHWKRFDPVPKGFDKDDPYDVADYLNQNPERMDGIINACSEGRGGMHHYGGIMWRDKDEPLYESFPQIFGHSSSPEVRQQGDSYCIDTSKHSKLAAIWLPELKIVEVDDEDDDE